MHPIGDLAWGSPGSEPAARPYAAGVWLTRKGSRLTALRAALGRWTPTLAWGEALLRGAGRSGLVPRPPPPGPPLEGPGLWGGLRPGGTAAPNPTRGHGAHSPRGMCRRLWTAADVPPWPLGEGSPGPA